MHMHSKQTVVSIHIDATIDASIAEFIHHAIAKAENKKAECLIIHLNTPGSLLEIQPLHCGDIVESAVPVVCLCQRGCWRRFGLCLYNPIRNIAAMAPGTNIGAAHPVTGRLDSVMLLVERVRIEISLQIWTRWRR